MTGANKLMGKTRMTVMTWMIGITMMSEMTGLTGITFLLGCMG